MTTAFTIAVFIVWLTPLIVATYSLYTVVTEDSATINDKAIWSLLVVFVPIIGLLVWFIAVRPYLRERAALHHAFPQYTQEQIHAYQAHLEHARGEHLQQSQQPQAQRPQTQHHGGLAYAPHPASAYPTSQFTQQQVAAPAYTTYEGPANAHPAHQEAPQPNTAPQHYQSRSPQNTAENTTENNRDENTNDTNAYDNNLVVDEHEAHNILNPQAQTTTTYTKFSDMKKRQ